MPTSRRSTIKVLTDAEHRTAIDKALEAAGCGLEELREQARQGHFVNKKAHDAWFVVSTLTSE